MSVFVLHVRHDNEALGLGLPLAVAISVAFVVSVALRSTIMGPVALQRSKMLLMLVLVYKKKEESKNKVHRSVS